MTTIYNQTCLILKISLRAKIDTLDTDVGAHIFLHKYQIKVNEEPLEGYEV
jgi:hypothetical protein